MDSLSAIQIRRAEEQMVSAWRVVPTAEARAEMEKAGRACAIQGCGNGLPQGDRHRVCRTCRSKGLVAAPCKGCGGQIRRCDQTGVAASRRGYCRKCRAEMPIPLSPACWRRGQSGNSRGTPKAERRYATTHELRLGAYGDKP